MSMAARRTGRFATMPMGRWPEPPSERVPEPDPDWDGNGPPPQWRRLPREGLRIRQPVQTVLELHLNDAQSEWLHPTATRTGQDYFEVILQLVEQARQVDEAATDAPAEAAPAERATA